ncbi:MAG: hypothetical protein ACI4PM_04310 [Butyricicoccus sp.]
MKKRKSRILTVLLLALLTIPMFATTNAFAATDVTSSMQSNANIKRMVKYVNNYMVSSIGTSSKKSSTKTLTLSKRVKWNITAQVRANYISSSGTWTKSQVTKTYTNLFGGTADTSVIPTYSKPSSKWRIARNGSTYCYMYGDWGSYRPLYKITKVVRVKSGTYDVTFSNRIDCLEDDDPSYKIGTTTMRLTRSSKSSYNYTISSIKYSCTGA